MKNMAVIRLQNLGPSPSSSANRNTQEINQEIRFLWGFSYWALSEKSLCSDNAWTFQAYFPVARLTYLTWNTAIKEVEEKLVLFPLQCVLIK